MLSGLGTKLAKYKYKIMSLGAFILAMISLGAVSQMDWITQVKNKPFLDIRDYGAKGNGTTDDAAAIRAALAAGLAQGRDVYCPAGTYLINTSLGNIGTNYSFVTVGKDCNLKAGANMSVMATVSGSAPPPYNKSSLRGIHFDCNSHATTAINFTNSGAGYVNGYKVEGLRVDNCTGDGIVTGNHFWDVGFYNISSLNNTGWGINFGTGDDAGASINIYNGSIGNNTAGQVKINNAGAGGADYQFFGTSFGDGTVWGIQAGTSSTPGLNVGLYGCHIEMAAQWVKNYGIMTIAGIFATNGSASGTLGYLIDNEGYLNLFGGRTVNGGVGTIMNPAQTGFTTAYSVLQLPIEKTPFYEDMDGNLQVRTLTVTGAIDVAGVATIGGDLIADGYLKTFSGIKAVSGGGIPFINSSGTTVGKIGNDGTLFFNTNSTTSSGNIYGAFTGNRSLKVPDTDGTIPAFSGAPLVNHGACVKSHSLTGSILGYCSTVLASDGTCTCN